MDEEGRPTVLSVIVTCVALHLQVVGLATPGWYYIGHGIDTLHFGLWYVVSCYHSMCAARSIVVGDFLENFDQTLIVSSNVYRGLTVAGAIACLVALIILILRRKSSKPTPTVLKITIIFFLLLSGILAITAAVMFVIGLKREHELKAFPYSAFITCLGGFWTIITFFVLMCKTVCGCRRNVNRAASQGGMVMMMNPAPYTIGEV